MSKRSAEFSDCGTPFPFKKSHISPFTIEQQYDPRLDQILVKLDRIEERLEALMKGNEDMYLKIVQIKRDTNQIQEEFLKKYNEILRILEIVCLKLNENTIINENLFEMQTDRTNHDYFA